jgi:hypothetical protein
LFFDNKLGCFKGIALLTNTQAKQQKSENEKEQSLVGLTTVMKKVQNIKLTIVDGVSLDVFGLHTSGPEGDHGHVLVLELDGAVCRHAIDTRLANSVGNIEEVVPAAVR